MKSGACGGMDQELYAISLWEAGPGCCKRLEVFVTDIYSSPEGYQEGPPENVLCARPALQIKSVSSWGTLKKNYDTALFAKAVNCLRGRRPDEW